MDAAHTQHIPRCITCDIPGIEYLRAKSAFSATDETFLIKKCPGCGLLWVDPRPNPEAIGAYYTDLEPREPILRYPSGRSVKTLVRNAILSAHYGYNHLAQNPLYRLMGRMLARIPWLAHKATHEIGILFPRYTPGSTNLIVDIGCGAGNYLAVMKNLGWEVLGIELEEEAAEIARQRGIKVHSGTLEDAHLPDACASHISMNHVLEHLFNPTATIKECMRVLKPGGRLSIRMPNAQSLGFALFTKNWIGLDPPRHLYVFSPQSIRALFKAFPLQTLLVKTSAQSAKFFYDVSSFLPRYRQNQPIRYPRHAGRTLFAAKERLLCAMGKECGEEIEILAIR